MCVCVCVGGGGVRVSVRVCVCVCAHAFKIPALFNLSGHQGISIAQEEHYKDMGTNTRLLQNNDGQHIPKLVLTLHVHSSEVYYIKL